MSFQCSSYHTSSAWYPIIRYLERSAGITHDTPAEQKFQKLRAVVHDFLDDAELALLASLLSISSETAAHLDLTPQQQKNRTFATLLKLLQAQTRRSPAILVFEDVHWIDPTSFELLERLRDQVQSWRMCVIVLFRPELSLPWMEAPQVAALTVNRLDRDQVAAMAKLLSANAELPGAITDQIVTKSDGVPLFVEEMTKAVLDYQRSSEAQLLSDFRSRITVPDTLHESLMARLDQVAPMKACFGAVARAIKSMHSSTLSFRTKPTPACCARSDASCIYGRRKCFAEISSTLAMPRPRLWPIITRGQAS
jgi:predicted ATPase